MHVYVGTVSYPDYQCHGQIWAKPETLIWTTPFDNIRQCLWLYHSYCKILFSNHHLNTHIYPLLKSLVEQNDNKQWVSYVCLQNKKPVRYSACIKRTVLTPTLTCKIYVMLLLMKWKLPNKVLKWRCTSDIFKIYSQILHNSYHIDLNEIKILIEHQVAHQHQ